MMQTALYLANIKTRLSQIGKYSVFASPKSSLIQMDTDASVFLNMTGGPVTACFFRARKLRAKKTCRCHPYLI